MNRQAISDAAIALLKASSPSEQSILARCRSINLQIREFLAEKIQIEWQCGDAAALARADEISRPGALKVDVPGALFAELGARLIGDRLILDAVVLRE
jgi:hypothetical protein